MVSSKTLDTINTYNVVPLNKTLDSTPTKAINKQRKTWRRIQLATINQAQSGTTASTIFLSTDIHSVSQAIICAHTNKIAIYKNSDTACCIESGAFEDVFPGYSTYKTYHRLSNRYDTLVDTTRLPIEGIGTAVYALNGWTILTRNALHIPSLRGPLWSLRKHHQIPGCGVYSSFKGGSYLFFLDFILQAEDSYDNIVSYRSLGTSHQGPIDYMEPISTRSTAMDTPSGRPSTINPDQKPQSSHIIPSY